MRHRALSICMIVFALLLSGGTGALAGKAFCAHSRIDASEQKDAHDCCQAKAEPTHDHCAAMQHEETSVRVAVSVAVVETATSESEGEACPGCCMSGSSEPSTTQANAGQPNQTKRSVQDAAPRSHTFAVNNLAPLTQSIVARQGAPPGTSAPTHILISVFLI